MWGGDESDTGEPQELPQSPLTRPLKSHLRASGGRGSPPRDFPDKGPWDRMHKTALTLRPVLPSASPPPRQFNTVQLPRWEGAPPTSKNLEELAEPAPQPGGLLYPTPLQHRETNRRVPAVPETAGGQLIQMRGQSRGVLLTATLRRDSQTPQEGPSPAGATQARTPELLCL